MVKAAKLEAWSLSCRGHTDLLEVWVMDRVIFQALDQVATFSYMMEEIQSYSPRCAGLGMVSGEDVLIYSFVLEFNEQPLSP